MLLPCRSLTEKYLVGVVADQRKARKQLSDGLCLMEVEIIAVRDGDMTAVAPKNA